MAVKKTIDRKCDGQLVNLLDWLTIQDLQLMLIERTQFNKFNGKKIVEDLKANRQLWQGAIMNTSSTQPLICLRDIDQNIWNMDTLFLRVKDFKNIALLKKLAETWRVDEVEVLDDKLCVKALSSYVMTIPNEYVMRFWWN